MGKERINLSIDRAAVDRGRLYSKMRRTSISRLVSDFLASLPIEEAIDRKPLTPAVGRLLGLASGGLDEEDYHRHLVEKYGR